MGKFPTSESNVAALAQELIAGFTAHVDVSPEPPVTPTSLTTTQTTFVTAKNA